MGVHEGKNVKVSISDLVYEINNAEVKPHRKPAQGMLQAMSFTEPERLRRMLYCQCEVPQPSSGVAMGINGRLQSHDVCDVCELEVKDYE